MSTTECEGLPSHLDDGGDAGTSDAQPVTAAAATGTRVVRSLTEWSPSVHGSPRGSLRYSPRGPASPSLSRTSGVSGGVTGSHQGGAAVHAAATEASSPRREGKAEPDAVPKTLAKVLTGPLAHLRVTDWKVSLRDCKVAPKKLKSLCKRLRFFKNAIFLDIPSCYAFRVIDAVLKALTEQPKIQRLNLHDNRLEDVSTEKLSTFVSRSCKLRMLDIGKNPELDFTAFFKALQRNRLLQVLYCSYNPLQNDAVPSLCRFISGPTHLHTLVLNNCNVSDECIARIFDAVRSNQRLTSLRLSRNRAAAASLTSMATCLAHNTSLTLLDLKGNRYLYRTKDAEDWSQLLANCVALRQLDLSRCHLGLIPMHGIAEGLRANTTLLKLCLDDNDIPSTRTQAGDSLCETYSVALCENTTLISLSLCRNPGLGAGVTHLASALVGNSTLTELNLERMGICDATPIVNALARNTTLLALNMKGNDVACDALWSTFAGHASLEALGVDESPCGLEPETASLVEDRLALVTARNSSRECMCLALLNTARPLMVAPRDDRAKASAGVLPWERRCRVWCLVLSRLPVAQGLPRVLFDNVLMYARDRGTLIQEPTPDAFFAAVFRQWWSMRIIPVDSEAPLMGNPLLSVAQPTQPNLTRSSGRKKRQSRKKDKE